MDTGVTLPSQLDLKGIKSYISLFFDTSPKEIPDFYSPIELKDEKDDNFHFLLPEEGWSYDISYNDFNQIVLARTSKTTPSFTQNLCSVSSPSKSDTPIELKVNVVGYPSERKKKWEDLLRNEPHNEDLWTIIFADIANFDALTTIQQICQLNKIPSSFIFKDPDENPENWRNICSRVEWENNVSLEIGTPNSQQIMPAKSPLILYPYLERITYIKNREETQFSSSNLLINFDNRRPYSYTHALLHSVLSNESHAKSVRSCQAGLLSERALDFAHRVTEILQPENPLQLTLSHFHNRSPQQRNKNTTITFKQYGENTHSLESVTILLDLQTGKFEGIKTGDSVIPANTLRLLSEELPSAYTSSQLNTALPGYFEKYPTNQDSPKQELHLLLAR